MHRFQTALESVYAQLSEAPICFGQGYVDAYEETVALVCDSLALAHERVEDTDFELTPAQTQLLQDRLTQRIAHHVPVAYLTQKSWLQGYAFFVDPRVIIPRSFMAELIVTQFEPWLDPNKIQHALDLCCGSACLAVLLAEFFPDAKVDAADISPVALEVAAINRARYAKEQRIALFTSNLFEGLGAQTYDLIVCNPPYVNHAAVLALPAEFCHEPTLAFEGGTDGMDLVSQILRAAPRYLNAGALLFLEIGNEYAHFVARFPRLEVTWVATHTRDDAVLFVTREELLRHLPM